MYFYFPHKSCFFALLFSKAEPWSSMPREKATETAWDGQTGPGKTTSLSSDFLHLLRKTRVSNASLCREKWFTPELCPLIHQKGKVPALVDLIINVYTGRTTKRKGEKPSPPRGASWEEEKDRERRVEGESCVSWLLQTSRQGDWGNIQSRRQASDPILVWFGDEKPHERPALEQPFCLLRQREGQQLATWNLPGIHWISWMPWEGRADPGGELWVVTQDGAKRELQPGLKGGQSTSGTAVEKSSLKGPLTPKKLRKTSSFLTLDVNNKRQQVACPVSRSVRNMVTSQR